MPYSGILLCEEISDLKVHFDPDSSANGASCISICSALSSSLICSILLISPSLTNCSASAILSFGFMFCVRRYSLEFAQGLKKISQRLTLLSYHQHTINIPLVPCKSLFQKVGVPADLVHQCVEVSLHFQSLEEGGFGHRRGKECEWGKGHDLKTQHKFLKQS